MRRVLVVGCGFLGRVLADIFHEKGWQVEGWTRSTEAASTNPTDRYPILPVDVGDRSAVSQRPGNFDAVVHCASTRGGDADLYRRTYLEGAANLLDRFVGATILFTSSTSVYAQNDGEWVTEESPAEPLHERGRILRESERRILERGGIVARLAGLYGPGRSALLAKFQGGQAVITRDRFVNQIHRDDAAAALSLLAALDVAAGQVYNVSDGQPMRLSECYQWLAQHLPPPSRVEPSPAAGASSKKRGESNKRVNNAKLIQAGWTPKYPSFREGMSRSVLACGSSTAR